MNQVTDRSTLCGRGSGAPPRAVRRRRRRRQQCASDGHERPARHALRATAVCRRGFDSGDGCLKLARAPAVLTSLIRIGSRGAGSSSASDPGVASERSWSTMRRLRNEPEREVSTNAGTASRSPRSAVVDRARVQLFATHRQLAPTRAVARCGHGQRCNAGQSPSTMIHALHAPKLRYMERAAPRYGSGQPQSCISD